MSANLFDRYINQEAIFLERGLVVNVRVLAVTPCSIEDKIGADFKLLALGFLRIPQSERFILPVNLNDIFEVGSVFLEDRNQIVCASGYISWKLIFNHEIKHRIHKEASEPVNFYKKLRQIVDEGFYEGTCQ